mgnify:FL=1
MNCFTTIMYLSIMNHELDTKNAIVKILEELLIDEYPQIMKIEVTSEVYDFNTIKHYRYTVYLGIKYDDMSLMSYEEINDMKKEAKRYCKYVMGKNEKVESVVMYDPRN